MNTHRVLVTGGAGYIGSVVVEELLSGGAERVVVLDDLSAGHESAVLSPAHLVRGDIGDRSLVERLLATEQLDSVIHMAASSLVGESSENPAKYYENNVVKSLGLLAATLAAGVKRFVFSSSAAVYGEPAGSPITEDFATAPSNPYGETKLVIEKALAWYRRAYGLSYVSLRYFNAAGATERNGEAHDPETHLIPRVLMAARGPNPSATIFGRDYPTADGTCVRDYIHVSDLAKAHTGALAALDRSPPCVLNLGCGGGFSVQEVVDVARQVTGKDIRVKWGPRREGDPGTLVASSLRAQQALGWSPERRELGVIVEDAWRWLLAHPNGYR
jgi:UDP-glucose 4-epimerase